MSDVLTVARQEILALRRERLPLLLLGVFIVMVSISSLIGWLTRSTVSAVWIQARTDGLTTAENPFANVPALYYTRNTVIYVVLIGALMAIVVGVMAAMRDRRAHTVDLILTRPVPVRKYLLGKVAGVAVAIGAVLAVVAAVTWVSISLITQGQMDLADTARLLAFFVLTEFLLVGFAAVGMISGLAVSRETTALLVPIIIWSVLTFIVPQIGTSQNPVSLLNPVPSVTTSGGAFDLVNTLVQPVAVSEQFKRLSSFVLGQSMEPGAFATSLAVVLGFGVAGVGAMALFGRDRLRGMLRD